MKRRFIAGAICPQCGAMDKIAVDGGAQHCVACNYSADSPPPASHAGAAPVPLKFNATSKPLAAPDDAGKTS